MCIHIYIYIYIYICVYIHIAKNPSLLQTGTTFRDTTAQRFSLRGQ